MGYLVKIMLTESISKGEVGIFYAAVSLLSLVGAYTDLGLTESLGYFLPKYIIRKRYESVKLLLATTLAVQVVSSTIVGTLLYFGAPWLASHYFSDARALPVLQILALFFFGMHLLSVMSSLFGAVQDTKFQK
jgi:O-antigen/teichoic acid export membrane protein